MNLKYTVSGYLYISPEDDCHDIVDAMLATDYNEEFCIAVDFSADFVTRLMEAGFLVMSMNISAGEGEPQYILLPKLHLTRSALFFENLHVKKSVRRLLGKYELRANTDFQYIIDRCVEKHGADWLTPPLVDCIKKIRDLNGQEQQSLSPWAHPWPASFALYRDGELAAGEFGIVCGRVYTSYSGFYNEDNAGTVQIILAARYLQEHGFSFFDMGMPLDYKARLGAIDISPDEFVRLFRAEF
ncbi:MAG: GNAT family N-acetyltransferase [Treponema sp.]|nr:GNAT family N-acetyltransferase [Treponema sp.]